ncbi:MAG: AfsR/SARP family transcriptional regulator, partial [Thermodesulfobacteriota bacterium]
QRLIREHNIEADPKYGYVENWPYPIKIQTLGGFQVLVEDKPLSFRRKGQKKPLELLKALVAFGGREIRDELLADALWPDADGESAHKAFTTTLYRLRKMIGHEEAMLLRGRRLSLNSAVCQVDVGRLDHCIQAARRFMGQTSEDDRQLKRTVDKILSLYSGHFLEGDPAAWVIGPREVLRSKVLSILMQIGNFWETRRRWDSAVDLYQKTLQLDPLAESACQGLMRCLGRLGRKAEALAAYRRCRMMLNCELRIDPSAETERLRKAVESE